MRVKQQGRGRNTGGAQLGSSPVEAFYRAPMASGAGRERDSQSKHQAHAISIVSVVQLPCPSLRATSLEAFAEFRETSKETMFDMV